MNTNQLKQLDQAATPGPWEAQEDDYGFGLYWPRTDHPTLHTIVDSGVCLMPPDAALIAAMRNALPALLDIAEAADTYRAAVEEGHEVDGGMAIKVAYRDLTNALARLDDAE